MNCKHIRKSRCNGTPVNKHGISRLHVLSLPFLPKLNRPVNLQSVPVSGLTPQTYQQEKKGGVTVVVGEDVSQRDENLENRDRRVVNRKLVDTFEKVLQYKN